MNQVRQGAYGSCFTPSIHRAVCSVGLFMSCLCGCHHYQKPKFDLDERTLLMVPLRDLSVPHGHGFGESARGKKVIEYMRSWGERNGTPVYTPARDADRVVRALTEWPAEEVTPEDWERLLKGIDVDLVLLGEIQEFRLKDQQTVNFYKGTVTAQFWLIRASNGQEIYRSNEINLSYPKGTEMEPPLTDFGTKPEDVEKGLIRALGDRIGKDLYGETTSWWDNK